MQWGGDNMEELDDPGGSDASDGRVCVLLYRVCVLWCAAGLTCVCVVL